MRIQEHQNKQNEQNMHMQSTYSISLSQKEELWIWITAKRAEDIFLSVRAQLARIYRGWTTSEVGGALNWIFQEVQAIDDRVIQFMGLIKTIALLQTLWAGNRGPFSAANMVRSQGIHASTLHGPVCTLGSVHYHNQLITYQATVLIPNLSFVYQ